MKAMILAAGRGSRMGDVTKTIPKPMVRYKGKPLIEHNIKRLQVAGICEIVINVSWLGSTIIEYLGDGSSLGVTINYLDEGQNMLGTGGGIKNALNLLGDDPFWLVNADVYSNYPFRNSFELEPSTLGHLILVDNPGHHPNGDFNLKNGRVEHNLEYNNHTYSGICIIAPEIFENINNTVFPLEPILFSLADRSLLTGEYHIGLWHDVGTVQRLRNLEEQS
jgi:N-acetyl-alpha-D-muramate 1-phosphate uridylyltransferase